MLPVAFLALAQAQVPAPLADLPFEMVGNRIYLRGRLNKRHVNVVLDTGAGSSVADATLAQAAGAKKKQEIAAAGAGAKSVKAWIVSGLTLTLDGTKIEHPMPITLPLAGLTALEGRPLETILGYDFLLRYRFEIDYAGRHLRIFPATENDVPLGAIVLPVEFVQNHPQTKGTIDLPGLGPRSVTMMLDTGATGAFSLTNRLVQAAGLDERYKDAQEIITGGGVGGDTKGRRIRLASAYLGKAPLAKPVALVDTTVGGATGKDAVYDVLVGAEALRRFTVTLDYAHHRIFLQPNPAIVEPFVGDRTGLAFMFVDGGYRVRQVVPGSPAAEAGIQAGDVLLTIGGRRPASLEELRQALHAADGTLHLKMRRDKTNRDVDLVAREIVP